MQASIAILVNAGVIQNEVRTLASALKNMNMKRIILDYLYAFCFMFIKTIIIAYFIIALIAIPIMLGYIVIEGWNLLFN